jgi:hypothetical protein
MTTVVDHLADDITLEYSLIDRMRVRGHIMNLQNVGMLGNFFKRFRQVDWIRPSDLQQLTTDFVQHVERLAAKQNIPLLSTQTGEDHVAQAAPHLAAVANQEEAIYCILKVQEETSSFVSYTPKTGTDQERKIARGRRRVNHYYFFIKDRDFGVGNWIRISSYAPFTVTVCFNGHHFVAQQLRKRGVSFETRDNLFVAVGNAKVFQQCCQALTASTIERFCNRWVYQCISLFTPAARQDGFRYQWYLDQVERCHNAIFRSADRLNAYFGRLLDLGRSIGQPHVIARLFQRRVHARRTGGRLYRVSQEDYCLKAWHKKTYLKQYNKQGLGLRTETCTNDVREFGTKKALANLAYLLQCMDHCNQRLLRWQDTIDQTTVSTGFVEKLGQPTFPAKGPRVPGLRLDSLRLTRVLAAVLQFAHLINGFTNRELRRYLHRRFGLSPDEYTATQLRYDLLKLRAKGMIRKLEGQSRYILTPKGLTEGTAMVKLKECLNGTVGEPVTAPAEATEVESGDTIVLLEQVQNHYRQVRRSLADLLDCVGLKATG